MYLVTPEMLAELAGECVGVTMYTAISSQGVLRLWPVRLPGPDGKDLAHACGASLLARSPEWLLSRKAAANADMPSRLSVTGRSTICYSITSSVMARSCGGTSMPSSLAVCRLMTNSDLTDCTTGRSAGLAPLRMRPV
jgi:hypothetical protein